MPKLVLILAFVSVFPAIARADHLADPEYQPAGDSAYTLDLELDGYINGKMHKDRLMTFRGCTLERDAAYMYALMWEAAKQDGITLRTTDCYRTFNRQDAAYNRRCPATDVPVYDTDPITGERWQIGVTSKRICTGPPTAEAGYSNHGWGRAIDFRTRRGRSLGCSSEEFHWLQSNSHRFGWVHPRWAWCDRDSREPWHFEYAGVTDPTLVGYVGISETLLNILE
jgi:hypothetical protein